MILPPRSRYHFSYGHFDTELRYRRMNVPPATLLLVVLSICGAALALAAFVWAVRTGQLDQTNAGGLVIFDDEEPAGTPSGPVFPKRKEGAGL